MTTITTYQFTTASNYSYDTDLIEFVDGKAQLKLQDNPNQTFTEDFADDTGFTYDNTKAEFAAGVVRQKLITTTGQTFTEDFANDTGFTYDNTKAEFVAGKVQQKDKAPTDSTSVGTYTTDINLNYGEGVLTGTATGGASVVSNRLDVTGGTSKYVSYDAAGNASSQQTLTLRFKYTPNYTGGPLTIRGMFVICEGHNLTDNSIGMYHGSGGILHLYITDQAGGLILDVSDTWLPNSGVTYEFEVNTDLTSGETRLFIDGVLSLSDLISTGTRNSDIGLFRVGANAGGTWNSDAYFEDVVVFDTVQHTTNYTPGYILSEYKYIESKIELPQFSFAGLGSISDYTAFSTTDGNSPRYIVNDEYWNGAAWVSSDGTYAQANSEADVNTNIPALTETDTVNVDLVFGDGSSLMESDNLILTYSSAVYPTSKIELPQFSYSGAGEIQTFTSFSTTEANIPHYVINDLYYNSGWVSSDGTYAQSNSEAEILSNIISLPATDNINVDIVFDDGTVQMSADLLTLTYTSQIYPTTNPALVPNSTFRTSDWENISTTVTEVGSDLVKFTALCGAQDRWVTGGSAEDSNGTYAESNTIAELVSDISDLITTQCASTAKIFLHSDDGLTTPSIDVMTITYNLAPIIPVLTVCSFDGYIYDHDGTVASEVVQIRPFQGFINSTALHIYEWETLGTTDVNGWFTADIYVQAENQFWEMKVGKQRYKFSLPNASEADFSSLLSFEVVDV